MFLLVFGNSAVAYAKTPTNELTLSGEILSEVYASSGEDAISDPVYSFDKREIGEQIAQAMKNHDDSLTVYYTYNSELQPTEDEIKAVINELFEAAFFETESGIMGDYLRNAYTSCIYALEEGSAYIPDTKTCEFIITYNFTYYITKQQEQELTAEIDKVIDSFGFTNQTTDRQKIDKIYAFITNSIVYDYENLEDDNYKLKHTAYAALMHKTSVCQGYAVLLYRMLKECGIDNRIITGYSGSERDEKHAWNIVEIDDKYYYCDATWDAESVLFGYYLKNTTDFTNHINDDEFNTAEFKEKYPIASESLDVLVENLQQGDYKYIATGGRAIITEYVGNDVNVTVPSVLGDSLVYYIENEAFYEEENLQTLTFSEGIGRLGIWSVQRCKSLEAVNYPSTMRIEDYGDKGYSTSPLECTNLKTITVAEGNPFIKLDENGVLYTADMKTLLQCPSKVEFTEYTVPNGVESIGNNAFYDCNSIEKITLPTTIKNVFLWAFCGASALEQVDFPEGLELIGQFVFTNTKIKNINIPKTVTKIMHSAFVNCYLESITVDEGNNIYFMSNGALCDVYGNLHKYVGIATEYTVPNGITTIEEFAFEKNKTLKKVNLPDTLIHIKQAAFSGCVGLEHIAIPNGTKKIDGVAFSGCDMLASIIIPESVINLDDTVLWYSPYRYTTVYGKSGTAAETFAANTMLPFKDMSEFKCPDGHDFELTILSENEMISTYCQKCKICDCVTKEYSVIRQSIDNAVVTLAKDSYEYTGEDFNPEIESVVLDGKELISGVDYEMAYTIGCEAVGTATVFINGIGNYFGQIFKSFEITQADISNADVKLDKTSFTYTGNEICPSITVKYGGIELSWLYDYVLSYENNSNVGTATVSIIGIGNFKGTIEKNFAIIKADQTAPAKPTIKDKTTTTVILNTVSGCEYSKDGVNWQSSTKFTGLKAYTTYNFYQRKKATSTKNASPKSVVLLVKTDCAHSYKTTVTTKATFTKNGKTTTKCTVCVNVSKTATVRYAKTVKLSTTTYTYDGKVKKPSVTVKDSAGKTISTTHYTVTYASGRKSVGKYKVTVKMKGYYTGTKTLSFTINPPKTTVSKLTAGKKSIKVAITKKSTQVTGYQIQYSTSKKFTSPKTKNITSYKTTSTTLTKLTSKKTYYVRVRTYKTVSGVKYYSCWSTYKYTKAK